MTTTDLPSLTDSAITAATNRQWQKAIDCNRQILKQDPANLAALNRLGKAQESLGLKKEARHTFQRVIELDKFNQIALNNLQRLKAKTATPTKSQATSPVTHFSFLEEPGKTKTASLINLASQSTLASLQNSQPVNLKPNKRHITITTNEDTYIGRLPDDLSLQLVRLIKLGNKYQAAIKTVSKNKINVFIREIKRSARLKNLPSFPTKDTNQYYKFLPTGPLVETPLEIPDSET